jgi:hypothetical protein
VNVPQIALAIFYAKMLTRRVGGDRFPDDPFEVTPRPIPLAAARCGGPCPGPSTAPCCARTRGATTTSGRPASLTARSGSPGQTSPRFILLVFRN